tara:strand:- start:116 stop:529 length:414 start_codon:yes stop_codon:yes gene_type:complete
MSISKILYSLDNSWKRDNILLKIKNGIDINEIVNEFLINNENKLKDLNNLLRPEDIDLLNQVEQLSACEAKLMNKINNLNYSKNIENTHKINEENISLSNRVSSNRISLFMINWSNKSVVIALLIISAIALSKQAWA